jgi:hypothetical protein
MSRPQQPDLPPDNEPGHHPAKEQDKPDLDKFAAKLGADPKAPAATSARKPKATPAKRPAAAPTSRPAGPTLQEAAHVAAPQPEPDGEHEPRLVGLMLLPLRQTVKGLELLDRTLSDRMTQKLRARGGRGPRGR